MKTNKEVRAIVVRRYPRAKARIEMFLRKNSLSDDGTKLLGMSASDWADVLGEKGSGKRMYEILNPTQGTGSAQIASAMIQLSAFFCACCVVKQSPKCELSWSRHPF